MRSAILAFLPFLSLLASADPITVTLLDQNSQLAAGAQNNAQECDVTATGRGPVSCYLPSTGSNIGFVNSGASIGAGYSLPPSTPAPVLTAWGGVVCCGYGYGRIQVSDTVLISGGTGTGYLNIDFAYSTFGYPHQSYAAWSVGQQQGSNAVVGVTTPQVWGVVTFEFGQPFTFEYSVNSAGGPSDPGPSQVSMQLLGAQIYTTQPTQCGWNVSANGWSNWGLCSDPNATSADVLGAIYGVNAVPEPNTFWLPLALFPLAPVFHISGRRRSHSTAR